ncbi:nodulin MtN21 /EamA-like transporter family protein [Euphorbia peplus]|nr:nodulin MtN21 /EamA-like transporter family protein [Euphorbia peplus]
MGWITICYTAIIGSAVRMNLVSWCLSRTGPVYVSMFKPLAFLLAVIADSIFLGDALFLGSLIGGSIIVSGFYAVIWGKVKEGKASDDSGEGSCASSSTSNCYQVPLLQNEIA